MDRPQHQGQHEWGGGAGGTRTADRWYEIGSLDTTPSLTQSGTLFDSAPSNPRFFWIPSIAANGQGHVSLNSSTAGVGRFAEVASAGRLAGDPLGTTQAFTIAQASTSSYDITVTDPQRWGDYSQTVVDPNDDMTFWTFQEYANTTDSWGVRVIQLKVPPPATPASSTPDPVDGGLSSVDVQITGTSAAGSAFFDPGPDLGGPGFPNHIQASVSDGVTVNSVTYTDPTHITLNLDTTAATAGPKDVTITNPDGQTATGVGVIGVGPWRDLTVSKTGTGSGTVTSSPVGIDCGSICTSAFFEGSTVTLTATPAAQSVFTGWSGGGCAGAGTCEVLLGADTAVIANFTTTTTTSGAVGAPPVVPPAPNTAITRAKIKGAARKATLIFSGLGGAGALSFLCKLDRKPLAPCSSPKRYRGLKRGKHVFQVQAVDATGQADATPARRRFKISG